jgi:hypothetical protein
MPGTLATLSLIAVCLAPAHAVQPTLLYVSSSGIDAWSGKLPAPNKAGTDGPFATLDRARAEVRKLKALGAVTVQLRGGIYRVTETLTLGAEDSGTATNPISWEAAPGETVRLLGSLRLTDWHPVSDPAVLERLDPTARKHVLQVDVKAAGVTDLARPTPVGGPAAQLICNARYMPLARYPNAGDWLKITGIPQGGTLVKTEMDDHYGRWAYSSDRPARWKDVSDLWVHGYWVWDWCDQYQRVQKLDLEKMEVSPEPPFHGYGYRKGQRFYFLNVLEELDSPGEWYLDRKTQLLYFWPPCPIKQAEIIFPELQKPMLELQNTQYVRVRGLTLEGSRGAAINLQGGSHNEIAGCTIRNFGADTAVSISGTENGLRSSDVYEVAGTGVALGGGDRKDLTPGDNYIANCHIYRAGQVFRTYHGAITLSGVHNRIAHCYIHDLPHQGIGYGGNDHVIEYCDFTRIAQETGDVGVTYTGTDWTFMGHEFRDNYFHNIHAPGSLGCFTIYPDLPCGGINLHHNVFYDVDQVFHTNSGRAMVIENNLFLRCRGISFNTWTQDHMFKLGGSWRMVENLLAVNYDQPPYSTRYPALQRLAADFALGDDKILQREIPRDNLVRRNVSWGKGFFLSVHPAASLDDVRCESNVIANDVVFSGSFDGSGKGRTYNNGDPEIAAELGKRGNIIVSSDPGLADLRVQGFHLSPAAQKVGVQPIPFAQIGLQLDQYRRTLPLVAYAPLIEPASRSFVNEQKVVMVSTPQPGRLSTVVRYTLDGREPTVQSAAYTQPLRLTKTTTVKAAAFVTEGWRTVQSETASATYKALTVQRGAVYLSDLPEQELVAYPPCWVKDQNHLGGTISLGGTQYAKGILLHPDMGADGKGVGRVTYSLAGPLGRVRRFRAVIGIEDSMEKYHLGSATFIVEVLRDGKWRRVFESPLLKLGDKPLAVDVDIAGAQQLRLTTTDGGDGIACDHAEWADARLQ